MTRAATKQAGVQAGHVLTSGPPTPDEPVGIKPATQPATAQRMTRAAAKQAEVQAGYVLRSGKVSAGQSAAKLMLASGRSSPAQTTRSARAARAAATAQQADMPSQSASATTAAHQGHDGTAQQGTPAAAMLASGVRGIYQTREVCCSACRTRSCCFCVTDISVTFWHTNRHMDLSNPT